MNVKSEDFERTFKSDEFERITKTNRAFLLVRIWHGVGGYILS